MDSTGSGSTSAPASTPGLGSVSAEAKVGGAAEAITFAGVTKSFGHKTVLQEFDLSVHRGEVFALLGANGAGKTTVINILTTLENTDSGAVHVMGVDVRTDPAEAKRRFAVTGQSAAVDTYLSTAENLVLLGRLSGLSRRAAKARSEELALSLSLNSFMDRRVGSLSGGMRRRLDLALSLVVPVDVLILDEPTTGLDTRSRRELWAEIERLSAEGTTVFLTTQYLEEADALADRIGLLDRGRLTGLGTPSQLKARVGEDTVAVHDEEGSTVAEEPTDGTVRGIAAVLTPLLDASPGASVSLRTPSLDDVFLAFTSTDDNPNR
ncbi:ATP-binding cassette domain-containing protein [Brevibacterium sp. BDJS002]|uniref:ABC transporter ATP-binding protein n=1 Tax=Brevibacterium aurantiacum TaxID=273384 RepID=A0A2A3ZGG2_BREAU|nr:MULTISPECIES: ATP-binding cassette domain-containing protein [Brevibacterium]MDN5549132.1 ATP-binding cassette domain-containing protein [Brevibacterium sp.]AZL12171.1 ABC transporter ATP-binding protein [Brevibacterium aurantiacum]MDN5711927.1 ATP-binding cassette domain-containing protein [Brevibacterium aurantiacum]MDN5738793.1 ATP-binding cassette domain-containing protein [Brevibacterium aurantiacum]MDN6378758.1 ATP-binding cassette domain-containing protein [Brevibacterium aurantiacum